MCLGHVRDIFGGYFGTCLDRFQEVEGKQILQMNKQGEQTCCNLLKMMLLI